MISWPPEEQQSRDVCRVSGDSVLSVSHTEMDSWCVMSPIWQRMDEESKSATVEPLSLWTSGRFNITVHDDVGHAAVSVLVFLLWWSYHTHLNVPFMVSALVLATIIFQRCTPPLVLQYPGCYLYFWEKKTWPPRVLSAICSKHNKPHLTNRWSAACLQLKRAYF